MNERINHAARAVIERDALNDVLSDEGITDASIVATAILVQVHATLALAEQQRIANLIAYVNKWTDGELLDVDAEIRKALGIE